jgi:hypothetical protein
MDGKPATSLTAVEAMSTMIPTFTYTRLTKRIFLTTPTGGFLVSNCCYSPTRSIFEEFIEPTGPAREWQWKRIVMNGASQNMCRVFDSREDYQNWLSSLGWPQQT